MTENNLEKMSNSVNVNKENDNIKSSSKYSKSADSWSASVPFQDSTNFKNMTSGFGNKSTNDDHSFMKKTSQSKKMTEKRENSKIYFEEGCKIIETTTKFLYSDGTM